MSVSKDISRSFFQQRWIIAIPVVLSIIVYWQTLRFDFVAYDDYELVYQNGDYLSQLSNIVTSFKTHVFTTHRAETPYYRPLVLVSLILDYQAWGLNPNGYHFTNMILHALIVLLVFLLVERLVRERIVALAASALFAVHPIQTQSVAWIPGRNDMLLGLFVVVMMYAYVRYRENPGTQRRYFRMTMIAFACSLLAKESGAYYFLLLPLYDLSYRRVTAKGFFDRRYLRDIFLIAVVLLLYLGLRLSIFGEVVGAERLYGGETTLRERIQQMPALVAAHCSLLLAPIHLSVAHPLDQLFWYHTPWLWFALIFPITLAAMLWWSWRHDRTICFGVGWLVVGLLPTLDVFPVAVPILEHRLYVPAVGFVLALCSTGYRLIANRQEAGRKEKVFVQIAGAVIVLFVIMSYARVFVWKNGESLWTDTIEKAPTYSRSYFNLAGYYFEHKEYMKTTELLEKYITLAPDDFMAHSKLRQTYYLMGQHGDAARVCRKMIALAPTNVNRYAEAAELYMQLNQADSAIAVYKEGIGRNPTSYQLCDLLARVYTRANRESEAEVWYRRAIELNPQFAQAHFDLGVLNASKGQSADALVHIEQGLRYGSPSKDVAQLLYHLYMEAGKTVQADEVRRRYNF
ncbi:MAG: tetratricopeptide repeat protein [Ignavibacteriae bacterium]|nr:tetratricopeptide repeat protein [Ignavibacteria bacterium]MBI3364628.1 tetratricopeptide repeat protein [Ignavibacteriota bacterium]